jgi:hypothetical protein
LPGLRQESRFTYRTAFAAGVQHRRDHVVLPRARPAAIAGSGVFQQVSIPRGPGALPGRR